MKAESFKIPLGKKITLDQYDPSWIPKWADKLEKASGKKAVKEQALKVLEDNRQKLIEMQELLWANSTYSILIILQGMDAAGKDGTIRHVMSGVNPQGCLVTGFKTPSAEELDHDFLWRYTKALPERGSFGIFNRSYYEDVLIVKVRPEVLAQQKIPPQNGGKLFWDQRYEDIKMFERHLVRNGTVVLKFFLHISKEEQKKRLIERIDDKNKEWKFSFTDLSERSKWDDYMNAYQEMLNRTNSEWAPWYVIPADKKWVNHATISEIILSQISNLGLKYPVLTEEQHEALEKAKTELERK
jgi:PPK2 family polyphosphate:nucleotide phosphotransferase